MANACTTGCELPHSISSSFHARLFLMGKGTKLEWLSRLRLSKGAAVIALFAILAHALFPVGWMPASAASSAQGFCPIIICTSAGITHVQMGPDGKPIEQAPNQGATHDHQCCPCTGVTLPLAPPETRIGDPRDPVALANRQVTSLLAVGTPASHSLLFERPNPCAALPPPPNEMTILRGATQSACP